MSAGDAAASRSWRAKKSRRWPRAGAPVAPARVPKLAQFDNGQTLQGRGRVLALPVRRCLALGSGCASSPSPSRGATVSSSTSMTCSTSASFPPSSSTGSTPGPAGAGLRGLPQHPSPLLRPARCDPGRVGGPLAVDATPAGPHLHAAHDPAQAGADRVRPPDPLRPAAQDPRGQAPGAPDAGPPLRHRHPARAPRAARRHLRGPVAHGGSLHPQAVTGTMPHCPRRPASERCAAMHPCWTTLNDVLPCMT
jgi:hypothetical protein